MGPIPYACATETLTFLFTDIEGSMAMLGRLGDSAYAEVLAVHHGLIRSALAAHDGGEIDTAGDGFFAVFGSPSACVAAVIDMQRSLRGQKWPHGEHVRVRMGVHSGEASQTTTGLVGFQVHRAARVAAVAHGGQVVLSSTAAALVADSMPDGAQLKDLGLHRLKDLGQPERIFQLEAAGLEAEFPPLRSLDNPALLHNLPERLTSFVGREGERAALRALVDSCRLVTLTGPGGSGKTRLSLQVAAELLDGRGDGVWFVELAGLSDPGQVAPAIADVLHMKPPPDRPVLESLADVLSHQHTLLLLDNCEHVIDACTKVADFLLRSCPKVHIFATSREPFGTDGETIYRVPPLSLPSPAEEDATAVLSSDAVALFVERASSNQPSFALNDKNSALVASLCRRLDGIPLALELAAARLRSLSLAQVHDHLDDRFRLLTGGSRSALPRQQTLLATVEWSYELLNQAERQLLKQLSAFAGGFDLEATGALCAAGDDLFGVLEHLCSLVDKSLVVADTAAAGDVRYRLLETIRQYALHKLRGEDGEEACAALREAHARVYLRLAEAAEPHLRGGPSQVEWLHRLDDDRDNLHAAAAHLLGDAGDIKAALVLAKSLGWYWYIRARHLDGLAVYEALSGRPEMKEVCALTVEVLLGHSWLARDFSLATATALTAAALPVARGLGDVGLTSWVLAWAAQYAYFSGDPATADRLGVEAVAMARSSGDPILLGYVLCFSCGLTRANYEEAVATLEAAGHRATQAFALVNLANCDLIDGDAPAARRHAEEAQAVYDSLGIGTDSEVELQLALALVADGDFPAARQWYLRALRSFRRTGRLDGDFLTYVLLGIALCDSADGARARAACLHGAADMQAERAGAPLQPVERRLADEDRERLSEMMGAQGFAAAYETGRQLSKEAAIELTLQGEVSGEASLRRGPPVRWGA